MTPRLRAAAALGLLAALAVGGCSASSRPTASGPSGSPSRTHRSASGGPTPETSTSPPRSSSTSPSGPSSTPPSSPHHPASTPPTSVPTSSPVPPPSTCHKITIRVLLGSGALGYEYAALQFVNTGKHACTLVGVPTVTLLRNGAQVGTVSQPSSTRAPFDTYRLAPGATAESKLKDFSSCNAPLSDSIAVRAPGSDESSTRPGELRACRLVVYPLGAPE